MRVPGYEIMLKDESGREVMDGHEGMMWIHGHSSTPMCGGVDLIATDKLESPSARSGKRAHAAEAWYGFGVPVRDPADIVMMLRNETTDSRHAQPHPRRAAHV